MIDVSRGWKEIGVILIVESKRCVDAMPGQGNRWTAALLPRRRERAWMDGHRGDRFRCP